jgi:UDP-N-acetylmuramate: L-alanyl-gamma-D-glutamyl-meso-diaminopimelate ligase
MSERIHILGICGIGMAQLASQLSHRGYRVSGADTAVAPPASEILESVGIVPRVGYGHFHGEPPDAVVVGNAVKADNPEAVSLEELGVPVLSLPQAVNRYLLEGVPTAVVAGTHGKTTTTALVGHGLAVAGQSPRVFVGGLTRGDSLSGAGTGNIGVVEGDEYDTAWFDKGAKLLHFQARWAVLTDLEYDHADIYPSIEAIEEVFRQFLAENLTDDAMIIYRGGNDRLRRLALERGGRSVSFGPESGAACRWEALGAGPGWTQGRISPWGMPPIEFRWPMMGAHNLANAAAALPVWLDAGVPVDGVVEALEGFPGVARRMEIVFPGPPTIIDDFAHHPTAVAASIATVRAHYPGRPVLAVFEPRSATSRRRVFAEAYARAFQGADAVWFLPATRLESIAEGDRIDLPGLAAEVTSAGVPTTIGSGDAAELAALAEGMGEPVILVMTSGPSRWLIEPLTARLR